MSTENPDSSGTSDFKKLTNLVIRTATSKIFIVFAIATIGFLMVILSLKLGVHLTPSSNFGESIEGVVPTWYWMGIAIMIASISYMLTHLDQKKLRIPFFLVCAMLLVSMRSVLAILSPYPIVQDTWGEIYTTGIWHKYGIFSQQGLLFFSGGYVRAWPSAFLLAYLITSAGVPIYTFYQWAPTIISISELIVVYYLFKELANTRVAMVSAFLFTLINTAGFFPLHYSPQTLGALLYLLAMYVITKAYKTRETKHLALAFVSILAVVFTHHMSTFFLGLSLAGTYFIKYFFALQQKLDKKKKLLALSVKRDPFIKISLPLAIFTFALWYFYGFIVYRVDATWMLTEIMKLLTTHQPRYEAGYVGRYFQISLLSQMSILVFPAFILATAAFCIFRRLLKRESMEGYLWLTIGWAGALILAFILGNLLYGNYIDPLRAQEIITVALYPASALFLLTLLESKSTHKKALITVLLIVVAFFSALSISRGAQKIVYFEPPWWVKPLIP